VRLLIAAMLAATHADVFGRGSVMFDYFTDQWTEVLRCPKWGNTGMASLSQNDDYVATIRSVPDGFKVKRCRVAVPVGTRCEQSGPLYRAGGNDTLCESAIDSRSRPCPTTMRCRISLNCRIAAFRSGRWSATGQRAGQVAAEGD